MRAQGWWVSTAQPADGCACRYRSQRHRLSSSHHLSNDAHAIVSRFGKLPLNRKWRLMAASVNIYFNNRGDTPKVGSTVACLCPSVQVFDFTEWKDLGISAYTDVRVHRPPIKLRARSPMWMIQCVGHMRLFVWKVSLSRKEGNCEEEKLEMIAKIKKSNKRSTDSGSGGEFCSHSYSI